MDREDFIMWLDSIGAIYQDLTEGRGIETVMVFGKDEYLKKKIHPRKNKNMFVPYLRVSWHYEDPRVLYTRWNGLTGYMNEQTIKDIIVNGV